MRDFNPKTSFIYCCAISLLHLMSRYNSQDDDCVMVLRYEIKGFILIDCLFTRKVCVE